ncbi:MAG: amidohydrolase family protein [Thermodesulfovibrionales bacterium]|nr:amidohydrolase family protein [Thermodesulfovibrionales bacterium]
MKIDVHFHALGNGSDIESVETDIFFRATDNNHWFTRILYNLVEEDLIKLEADLNNDGKISTLEYFELTYRLLRDSEELDAIVLLALDGVYSPRTGVLDEKRTDLWVSNRFLYRKIKELNERLRKEGKTEKRFFLGASINPNRKDWQFELEFAINQLEAVLIKLIPSAQHIHLMDERHREFYRTLTRYNIPLLCHVGPEYSFAEGIRNRRLDDFRFLEKPLKEGVTVIAAHCATPVFPLIDKNYLKEFYIFMKEANGGGKINLWGDTSALSLSTRTPLLPQILEIIPQNWLIHGSDFPIPIDGWAHLPWVTFDITPQEYLYIVKTKNPLDRDVRIKRAHGFIDSILTNAEKVLRLPAF